MVTGVVIDTEFWGTSLAEWKVEVREVLWLVVRSC